MKLSIAGKGGVGKTTLTGLISRELVRRGLGVLAVDCDPNPMLAEELGLRSHELERFEAEGGLRRAGDSLELARDPELVEVAAGLALLGGPPSATPLADAVARGIAGVLLADRFDHVVTDLGAGAEMARIAVGGALNPADLCLVVDDGTRGARSSADRIEIAARARAVPVLRTENRRGEAREVAGELVGRLLRE